MSVEKTLEYDFVVVGGGLAGVGAALSASRKGVKTALVQDRPVLGGNSSREIRVAPAGAGAYHAWATETGIISELLDTDRAVNHEGLSNGRMNSVYDQVLFDACRTQANLDLYLSTIVFGTQMRDAASIESLSALQLGTEEQYRFCAPLFADCTGDGAVVAWAGCESMIAEKLMGSSILFTAVETGEEAPFIPPEWSHPYADEESLVFRHPDKFESGYYWIEIGWPYDTISENEQIRDTLLAHVYGVWDHIKNRCVKPGLRERARTWALDWVGVIPGKRESRRTIGGYVITGEDLLARQNHPDDVCYGGWYVDLHIDGGLLAPARPPNPVFNPLSEDQKEPFILSLFSIPFRCLYARDVKNLLIAGRHLSADRMAFGALRVMRTTALTGEAVGAAAWVCKRYGIVPSGLSARPDLVGELQDALIRDDMFIPGRPDTDSANLARHARVTASSTFLAAEPQADSGTVKWPAPMGIVMPVAGNAIDYVEIWIETGNEHATVRLVIEPLTDIWDNIGKGGVAHECAPVFLMKRTSGWVRFPIEFIPSTPVVRLAIDSDNPVSLGFNRRLLPGYFRQKLERGVWHSRFGSEQGVHIPVRIFPLQSLFGPGQTINGWPRPVHAPNLWISDPDQPFPQWIELSWAAPVSIQRVILLFDTNLHLEHRLRSGFHRSPECVKDYTIEAKVDGRWTAVSRTRGNYHRRNECYFDAALTESLRVVIEASNGDPSARIYEIKVYKQ